MSTPRFDRDELAADRPGLRRVARQSLITGVAILVPLAVTLFVVGFAVNFVTQTLDPVVTVVQNYLLPSESPSDVLIKAVTVTTLLSVVLLVGFVAEFTSYGARVGAGFDNVMTAIPGLGSVYTSFDEMSELLLDSDTDSFQDVKLVEYPGDGSYTVAFKTAETPDRIAEATGNDDMVTLFMPMAPNPVMGGFVIHVSRARVVDVDMTVEEGIRSIVTSGVAIGEPEHDGPSLSEDELRTLGGTPPVDDGDDPALNADGPGVGARNDDGDAER